VNQGTDAGRFVEQKAYCEAARDKNEPMNLVCSGLGPEDNP
jgi:hypothetical protein